MFKFLPGILLIQLATIALVFALIESPFGSLQVAAIALLGLVFSLLAAFWFASIASNLHKDELARAREYHKDELAKAREYYSQDREKLLVATEKQKVAFLKEAHEKILRESNAAHSKANFKVGAMFSLAVGAGALLVFSQFITMGLLVLATSGGALTGYVVRARQDYLARKKLQDRERFIGFQNPPLKAIEQKPREKHEASK